MIAVLALAWAGPADPIVGSAGFVLEPVVLPDVPDLRKVESSGLGVTGDACVSLSDGTTLSTTGGGWPTDGPAWVVAFTAGVVTITAVTCTPTEVLCNGRDDDCDPATLDGVDGDGDGSAACLDCDDTNPAVFPGASEQTCNGLDDDCDAATPDTADGDGDGVDCTADCDDTNPNAFPGARQVCTSVDLDCLPSTDGYFDDLDGDGAGVCVDDCNDNDPAIPGLLEIACNGLDDDCDPLTPDGPDLDGDGFSSCGNDCDDEDPNVHPGQLEVGCNGVDDDCDPLTSDAQDSDEDGVSCLTDCDDTNPEVRPGAPERCDNGVDDDCDPATVDVGDNDGDGVACPVDCDDTRPDVVPRRVPLAVIDIASALEPSENLVAILDDTDTVAADAAAVYLPAPRGVIRVGLDGSVERLFSDADLSAAFHVDLSARWPGYGGNWTTVAAHLAPSGEVVAVARFSGSVEAMAAFVVEADGSLRPLAVLWDMLESPRVVHHAGLNALLVHASRTATPYRQSQLAVLPLVNGSPEAGRALDVSDLTHPGPGGRVRLVQGNDGDVLGAVDGELRLLSVDLAVLDADLDGLSAEQESAAGTDPWRADSDGDGHRDGAELGFQDTDPLSVDAVAVDTRLWASSNEVESWPLLEDSFGQLRSYDQVDGIFCGNATCVREDATTFQVAFDAAFYSVDGTRAFRVLPDAGLERQDLTSGSISTLDLGIQSPSVIVRAFLDESVLGLIRDSQGDEQLWSYAVGRPPQPLSDPTLAGGCALLRTSAALGTCPAHARGVLSILPVGHDDSTDRVFVRLATNTGRATLVSVGANDESFVTDLEAIERHRTLQRLERLPSGGWLAHFGDQSLDVLDAAFRPVPARQPFIRDFGGWFRDGFMQGAQVETGSLLVPVPRAIQPGEVLVAASLAPFLADQRPGLWRYSGEGAVAPWLPSERFAANADAPGQVSLDLAPLGAIRSLSATGAEACAVEPDTGRVWRIDLQGDAESAAVTWVEEGAGAVACAYDGSQLTLVRDSALELPGGAVTLPYAPVGLLRFDDWWVAWSDGLHPAVCVDASGVVSTTDAFAQAVGRAGREEAVVWVEPERMPLASNVDAFCAAELPGHVVYTRAQLGSMGLLKDGPGLPYALPVDLFLATFFEQQFSEGASVAVRQDGMLLYAPWMLGPGGFGEGNASGVVSQGRPAYLFRVLGSWARMRPVASDPIERVYAASPWVRPDQEVYIATEVARSVSAMAPVPGEWEGRSWPHEDVSSGPVAAEAPFALPPWEPTLEPLRAFEPGPSPEVEEAPAACGCQVQQLPWGWLWLMGMMVARRRQSKWD